MRVIHRGERVSAFVPVFARYAFEDWVAPHRRVAALPTLTCEERADFARALKAALLKLDGRWQRPMPYILAFYQAPTDGGEHLETHVRVEIYPALRMRDRLKYLAGSEIGAGVFTADTLPERSAMELRGVAANVDE